MKTEAEAGGMCPQAQERQGWLEPPEAERALSMEWILPESL